MKKNCIKGFALWPYFFRMHKGILFKIHVLRVLPLLFSNFLFCRISFESSDPPQNKLVLLGPHWDDCSDVEARSQRARGTREFITFLSKEAYAEGFYELLRLPFTKSRSTAYDLSERINYCALLFLNREISLSGDDRRQINALVSYVMRNLEYYGSRWTNNHYLNNARALLAASILLNDSHLARRSIFILTNALDVNFPDGLFCERSSSYQCLIVYWLKSIYVYLDLMNGPTKVKKRVLEIIGLNNLEALQHLNFGDNTPDFSKSNVQILSAFVDQFLPDVQYTEDSGWVRRCQAEHFDFFIVTKENIRYRPEHGHRNLGCFHLTFKGRPVFLSTSRHSYNKYAAARYVDPGLSSSGSLSVRGKSIYPKEATSPSYKLLSDIGRYPTVTCISNEDGEGQLSLRISSVRGLIHEKFLFSRDEFTIKLVHDLGMEVAICLLVAEDFDFSDGDLTSPELSFSIITSEDILSLRGESHTYSDDYGVLKKGTRLIVTFSETKSTQASFIKFKEKAYGVSI